MNAIASSTFNFYERAALHQEILKADTAPMHLPFTALRLSMKPYRAILPPADEVVIRLCLTHDTPLRVRDTDGWKLAGKANAPSVIVTPAAQACEFDAPHPHEMIVIGCDNRALSSLLTSHGLNADSTAAALSSLSIVHDMRVAALILDLWRELARAESSGTTLVIQGYWKLLLAALVNALLTPKAPTCFGMSQQDLRKVDTYIADNLCDQITAKDLADLVGMSISRFTKEFRDIRGLAPYQYVLAYRINQARLHISTSDLSLASIAMLCGFSSQSHMTDTFRCKLGQTPATFRHEHA
ncbi:helix-turn-helix transcriptional regulator [Litoreibacter roseus]|uniref:HTH araC/xylS-type domain-containing protein n=1 Tax=Litoreibacter roseus TaxID=2601869 RepID=A0A6N6JL71_9RHOB|nr:AraC family transcriptional regulator [Litoreibacter roseus]GFE67066.1 hypothetical protein KIN_41400 [Litoreibacter roseus]